MDRNLSMALAMAAAAAVGACGATVTGKGRGTAPACAGEVRAFLPEDWENAAAGAPNDLPAASPAARARRGTDRGAGR